MRFSGDNAWMRSVVPVVFGAMPLMTTLVARADVHERPPDPSRMSSAINQSLSLELPPFRDDDRRLTEAASAVEVDDAAGAPNDREPEHEGAPSSVLPHRADPTRQSGARPAGSVTSPFDLTSVAALAFVLLLMGGLVYVLRRFVPAFRAVDSDVLRVVARTGLSPKHSLALVRVGRRLVLVGLAGDRVQRLCEVTDPEEVAELAAHVGPSKPRGGAFETLLTDELKEHRRDRNDPPAEGDTGGTMRIRHRTGSGLADLRGRLRSLKAG